MIKVKGPRSLCGRQTTCGDAVMSFDSNAEAFVEMLYLRDIIDLCTHRAAFSYEVMAEPKAEEVEVKEAPKKVKKKAKPAPKPQPEPTPEPEPAPEAKPDGEE